MDIGIGEQVPVRIDEPRHYRHAACVELVYRANAGLAGAHRIDSSAVDLDPALLDMPAGAVKDARVGDLQVSEAAQVLAKQQSNKATRRVSYSARLHAGRLQQEEQTYQTQDCQRGYDAERAFKV